MSVTNGTLTVNADNKGSVNISSLLPDTSDFVTSSTLSSTLEDYQPLLVSGTSIKTINGISLLGSGNITIEGGGGGTVDQVYDPTSTNAQSGVAIAGAHFLTSSDLPTIGNGEITVYQGSSVKGSFRLNQTSNYSLNLDEGANFGSLRTPIPPQGFIPEGSSSTYPVMSLECIVTYTEETDPDTGDPVVDPETGMTSMTIGEILYYDMNTSSFYTFNGGGFDLYQGEVTDPYMSVGDFSASAGLLYRKWSYTDSSSSIESPTVEYYYTYGELSGGGGFGGSLSTYDSSGRYVGTTDITLSIDETGSGVTVSAVLTYSDSMTYKTLSKEWSGDIYSSSEDNTIITNSDGTIVANMGMKQNALIPGENISIDYTTNTISANISTTDYLNDYNAGALSSRGASYALKTKENILSSENTGDGVEITIEKGHNLPEGYTEYATLNCRNAYINTGLYGSEKTRFEIYGHYQYGDTSYTNLFGDRTTSGKHMCLYNGAWRVGSQNVSSYIFYNSYGSQSDHLFIGNQYGCIYDNTKDAFSTTPSAFTTTNTLLLMGVNGSSPTVSSQTFYFRYAKIYEEDTLVFYGVPAKRNSDSAMGIYDLVSKGFFEKAGGSGSFTAGAALTPTKRIVAKGGGGTVDQTYDATSANAQSGVAIAGELVNYMPLNSSSDIDIYANSVNFDLSDKLTLNSTPVLCQGWNSLADNIDGFGINIDTDGLWYSWNRNYTFYVDYESSSMYGYEYGSNNTVSHKHGIEVYGNGINFSNLNYESTITIPSDGSLALNGHNIITDNNLKTINNQSIIGSGNINISGGTTYTAGNGISITNDTISIDSSVVATQTDISDMATQTWVGNQNYLTSSALTNYVTTNTAQDISGRKTFLGEKAIYFKQVATSNKLGFTLYNPSGGELAALEYRPNTISGASLLALNCPQTTGGYVGFRYWGTPAVNIVAPKVATAGNYFMATHITNGSTTVTANNTGTVNISTLLPDVSGFATQTWVQNQNYITSAALTDYVTNTSLATTLADYVTNSALTTTLADYALSADIPTKTSDLTNDSNFATVSQIPTNNNQLTNGAGYITNSALNGYAQTADLATVATSGSYNDLSDKPTIPAVQVNADWNATSGLAQILNKPTIPTVGNGTVTINQGGVQKGTFTLNQSGDATINLDAGGGSSYTPGTGIDITNDTISVDSTILTTNTAQTITEDKTFSADIHLDGGDIILDSTTSNILGKTTGNVYRNIIARSVGSSEMVIGNQGDVLKLAGSLPHLKYNNADVALLADVPTVYNSTITFTQGGVNKGTITLNQSSNQTITLDAGSSGAVIDDTTPSTTTVYSSQKTQDLINALVARIMALEANINGGNA